MDIAAILFDADGVVQRPAANWRTLLAPLVRAGDDVDTFMMEVFAAERPCLTGIAEFPDVLTDVLARWGCQATATETLAAWMRIAVDAGILDEIRKLRRAGTRCYLASNQNAQRARYMSDVLGYAGIFDGMFYSCELGQTKSSPAYFQTVLRVLQVPAERVLLIDDSPENVATAADAGLLSIQFQANGSVTELNRILCEVGLKSSRNATRDDQL